MRTVFPFAALALCVATAPAGAHTLNFLGRFPDPFVSSDGVSHWYDVYNVTGCDGDGWSWEEAETFAESQFLTVTACGKEHTLRGHLATVTSLDELDSPNLNHNAGLVGAIGSDDGSAWTWVVGPEAGSPVDVSWGIPPYFFLCGHGNSCLGPPCNRLRVNDFGGYAVTDIEEFRPSPDCSPIGCTTGDNSFAVEYEADCTVLGVTGINNSSTGIHFLRPNPTRSRADVVYSIRVPGRVQLKVLDVAGRVVEQPVDEWESSGEHHATVGGQARTTGSPAVYLVQLCIDGKSVGHRELVILR